MLYVVLCLQKLCRGGYSAPDVFGDPGLLLPLVYKRKVEAVGRRIGLIAHYYEQNELKRKYGERFYVIELGTSNIEETIDKITSCEYVLSTGMHGLITAHAYGIPALWVLGSREICDGFKFEDYFSGVSIEPYKPLRLEILSSMSDKKIIDTCFNDLSSTMIDRERLVAIQNRLLHNAPFSIKSDVLLRNY